MNEDELSGAYRRNGNVARLPKAVRNKINGMIADGVPYRAIIEALGEEGKGLDISNLSRWKDGGYEDWRAEQAFIERTRARQETPRELVRDCDATEINHAALQLGTLHIFEALRDLGPGSLDKKLGGDCAAFARLLNALARASRETMLVQKYREACEQVRAALRPLQDPKRKLTQSERRAIVRNVDDILGLESVEDEERENGLSVLSVERGSVERGSVERESVERERGGSGEEQKAAGEPTPEGMGEANGTNGTDSNEGTKAGYEANNETEKGQKLAV